jgi:splicing factor 3A subunit 1
MTGLPPPPASLPAPPQASGSGSYSAATVSSGPQPASIYPGQPAPVMLPPLHYQGMDAAQPFGYQPAPPGSTSAPPGMHPSRIAALAAGGPIGTPPLTGTVRSADEMDADGMPPAKRQKVAKLPGGQCYPEADWINMHPVSSDSSSTVLKGVLMMMLTSIPYHCKCNFLTTHQNLSGSSMVVSP